MKYIFAILFLFLFFGGKNNQFPTYGYTMYDDKDRVFLSYHQQLLVRDIPNYYRYKLHIPLFIESETFYIVKRRTVDDTKLYLLMSSYDESFEIDEDTISKYFERIK